MTGLKPVYGGSSPPFLVTRGLKGRKQIFRSLTQFVELGRRQVLRRCGKEEGNREVILRLLL